MLRLFISYSHKDREWCDRLCSHLVGISKDLIGEIWYDKRISPGSEWNPEIIRHLDDADIILFLVSSNFVNAEYCPLEVERAMKRQIEGQCTVIPVILRHYNLSGSGYSHLQPSPQGGEPLDSAAWSDKDLALRTVSGEIEAAARLMLGNQPKHRPLPPNPAELQRLLHHLCDRIPQRQALHRALEPERRKMQRPFVIVVLGQQSDSLEWFLSRLEHILLKKYLSHAVGRLSPLQWPEYAGRRGPMDLFGPGIADSLNAHPFSSLEEMNASLSSLSLVNLLPSAVSAEKWDRKTEALFNAYLSLWNSWPRLPAERALIPVVCIEFQEAVPPHHRILRWLRKIDFDGMPELGGVVLPEMMPVSHNEFNDWLRLEEVRPRIPTPEHAIETSHQITGVFPSRMYNLAETHLPRFLAKL
jgi:hypothetical protein